MHRNKRRRVYFSDDGFDVSDFKPRYDAEKNFLFVGDDTFAAHSVVSSISRYAAIQDNIY